MHRLSFLHRWPSHRRLPCIGRHFCVQECARWDHEKLIEWGTEVYKSLGLPHDDAAIVSRCLVESDLRGQEGHGMQRTTVYAKRLRSGIVNPKPDVKFNHQSPAIATCDGDNGMGFVVATKAMAVALQKARGGGIGVVGAKRSTHFGSAAHYVSQAVEADMIGLACSNSSPAQPPWGGYKPWLGATPLAAGIPAGHQRPFVLDMATTVTARGKMRLAAERGEPIPAGIALDKHGRSTTDGMEAFHGVVLPFGGVKGSAVTMLVEILSGVLTGAAFGGRVSSLYNDFAQCQNVGHFIMAIDPNLFMPLPDFKIRMDELILLAKAQPLAAGFTEILIAGEPEDRSRARRLQEGVPMQDSVVKSLRAEGHALGIPFPPSRGL